MENAHLRMGILEYDRETERAATRVRVRVSHYIGEEESAHLVSVFGNDSDVGAITASVYEQARFRLDIPRWNQARGHLRRGRHLLPRQHQHSGQKADCPAHDCTLQRDTGPEFLVADISVTTGYNRGMDGDRSPARPSCNTELGRSHDEGAHREEPNYTPRRHRVLPGCGVGQHRGSA